MLPILNDTTKKQSLRPFKQKKGKDMKCRKYFLNKKSLHLCLVVSISSILLACGGGGSSNESPSNTAPIAHAGSDRNIPSSNIITLDGSNSSDPNGDTLSFHWQTVLIPTGSSASLSDEVIAQPEFTADIEGNYIFELIVNDGEFDSSPSRVTISYVYVDGNVAPVADAGTDKIVLTGVSVNLDGSDSSDSNSDSVSFSWYFQSIPGGSSAALSNYNMSNASFIADVDGAYIVNLVVNDGEFDSVTDTVTITAGSLSVLNDDFAGDGPLIGYTTNNASSLPNVARENGRYTATVLDNTNDITLHYHNDQGRLDGKLVSFPFEAVARNIGIGIIGDPATAPSTSGSSYVFAGVQVHVTDLDSRNSSHVVVGHRGGKPFTVEGKNTVNSSSSVNDAGANIVPSGKADIRIVGNPDRTLTVYWQTSNANPGADVDNWQLYRGTGTLPGSVPSYGANVYVGLITYAAGSTGVPFLGVCNSFTISD